MDGTRSLAAAGAGDGLDLALAERRRVAATEAREFDHLLEHLRQSGGEPPTSTAPGGERLRQYGGSGTPAVCEFTVCEISGALGLSPNGAGSLVADILDLAHRLPRLYAALHDGLVETWRVRKAATATREFTLAQVEAADRRLAADTVGDGTPMLCRVSAARLRQILEQIRNRTRPEDAEEEVAAARDERRVTIRPAGAGLAALDALICDEDGARLDQRLTQIVSWLHALGDDRPTTVLRSVAVGYLAEPDSLDALHAEVHETRQQARRGDGDGDSADCTADDADAEIDDADATGNAVALRSDALAPTRHEKSLPAAFTRSHPLPATTVYLHLDRDAGTWSMDGTGAITPAEAGQIIGHCQVTVKPVIDLAANLTYAGYVAPPRLKEQLALMNAGLCTFPFCDRPARTGEYDHVVDYADGGPTDSRNGHRLCTFHHRAKTFTDWTVQSPAPGAWLWHSPGNRAYLVTAGSTTRLDHHPQRRERPRAA